MKSVHIIWRIWNGKRNDTNTERYYVVANVKSCEQQDFHPQEIQHTNLQCKHQSEYWIKSPSLEQIQKCKYYWNELYMIKRGPFFWCETAKQCLLLKSLTFISVCLWKFSVIYVMVALAKGNYSFYPSFSPGPMWP